MKLSIATLTLVAGAALVPGAASAAIIAWDNADPSDTENIVTDSSVVIGDVIGAWNFGSKSGDKTVGTVTYAYASKGTTVTSGGISLENTFGAQYGTPWNGTEAAFKDVMGSQGAAAWRGGTTPILTLTGLAANTSYRIQFLLAANNATTITQTTVDITGAGNVTGIVQSNPQDGNAQDGLGQYIVGTLTTGAAETSAIITLDDKREMSAIVIAKNIPEPGSLALLGLGGLLVARRRRG